MTQRSLLLAMSRGLLLRCPACGIGPLFSGFLHVREKCPHCDEALHHHRADDMPPYVVTFIVGHVIVGLMLSYEMAYAPPMWLHAVIWLPLTLVMALLLLPPVKGAIVGYQWSFRMHGFGAGETHELL